MRALSLRQAARCETATHPRCTCRCGGKLHGAGRMATGAPRAEWERLPQDDPHYVSPRDGARGEGDEMKAGWHGEYGDSSRRYHVVDALGRCRACLDKLADARQVAGRLLELDQQIGQLRIADFTGCTVSGGDVTPPARLRL